MFFKIMEPDWVDVVGIDRYERVAVLTALFVPQPSGVADFVQDCSNPAGRLTLDFLPTAAHTNWRTTRRRIRGWHKLSEVHLCGALGKLQKRCRGVPITDCAVYVYQPWAPWPPRLVRRSRTGVYSHAIVHCRWRCVFPFLDSFVGYAHKVL